VRRGLLLFLREQIEGEKHRRREEYGRCGRLRGLHANGAGHAPALLEGRVVMLLASQQEKRERHPDGDGALEQDGPQGHAGDWMFGGAFNSKARHGQRQDRKVMDSPSLLW